MSRIGKKPIQIPAGVSVDITKENIIKVKGPKGELTQSYDKTINIKVDGNEIVLTRNNETRRTRALHGLYRALIANMIEGVSKGYERKLELIGTGYKAEMKGKALVLSLGYSHQIYFVPPDGVEIQVEPIARKIYAEGTPNQYLIAIIKLNGIDKQKLGWVASQIRGFNPPDVYKSKGIRYAEERVKLKAGKSAAK